MNGEQMYKWLGTLTKEERMDIMDITWWGVDEARECIQSMAEQEEMWLDKLTKDETDALFNLGDDDLKKAIDNALDDVEGDGEHAEKVRQAIKEQLLEIAKQKAKENRKEK